MRWLIVGPYPPSTDAGAAITRAVVAERLAAGDEVHVVSPAPSAAHEVLGTTGVAGVCRALLRSRRHDAVWIHIGSALGPTPHAGRVRAGAERAAMAAAIRATAAVTLSVGDIERFPGGRIGRLVLGSGASFECASTAERDVLVERGAPADAVTVRPVPRAHSTGVGSEGLGAGEPVVTPPTAVGDPPPLPTGADRASLERWIHDRASSTS